MNTFRIDPSELSSEELAIVTGQPAPARVRISRETFGPVVGNAGAVFPGDVLRSRCGIQKPFSRDRRDLSAPCMSATCPDPNCMAFADTAPIGRYWLEGAAIPCPACGAAGDAPCISTHHNVGRPIKSLHRGRRRIQRGKRL